MPSCLYTPLVQKARSAATATAKKKAELERRLQDVSGKLGSKAKQKKSRLLCYLVKTLRDDEHGFVVVVQVVAMGCLVVGVVWGA